MNLIEIETKMGKNGMIQIPKDELRVTGLKKGDVWTDKRLLC